MSQKTDNPTFPWTPRQLALAALLLAAGIAALWTTWCDWMYISYQIEEHSHVFLVVPFAAAILYVNRAGLRDVRGGPSWAGPALLAVGWAMAWHGFHHAHQSLWHMGAVLVALGALVSVLGHGVVVKYWPAFLLLVFMVPVPNGVRLGIAQPLQTAMARIVENILGFFGQPVGRQGNSLTINGQHVLIVEACNGLRMVFTLILVSWLFAFVTPLRNWVRWMVILLSPITALVCNAIRLIPTLLMYGHADKAVAKSFHDYAGWAMVPVAFFLLMGVIKFVEALGFEVRGDDDNGNSDNGNQGAAASVATATAATAAAV